MASVESAKRSGGDSLGTGRRKTSVARVRIRAGGGTIIVNGRPLEEYFVNEKDRNNVLAPLTGTDRLSSVNVAIKVHGGGISGQSAQPNWASPGR